MKKSKDCPIFSTKKNDGQNSNICPSGVWGLSPFDQQIQVRQKRDSVYSAYSLEQTPKKMRPYSEILPYTYPSLYEGKQCYIGFYAVDPSTGEMRRKRYRLGHIKGKIQRRRYARRMIYELMDKLDNGWNPWVQPIEEAVTPSFQQICDEYLIYIDQRLKSGTLRPDSHRTYKYSLGTFRKWCSQRRAPVTKCEQLTKSLCVKFLDYIHIEQGASARTTNGYKVWMSGFFGWMVDREYLNEKPTDGIKALPNKEPKSRELIPENELVRLNEYLRQENPHFLLAVYLLYYCFIRPKEMCMLTIGDFQLAKGVVIIPGNVAKNGRTESVTLPVKVIHLMIDLSIFVCPSSYYLFSDDFMPGRNPHKAKYLSDWWNYHVKRDLKWPKGYTFYSLKDTGITRLLHHVNALSVRDQARHSDISITNVYAQRDNQADEKLRDWSDVL